MNKEAASENQFFLPLKTNRRLSYRRIGQIISVINLIVFGFFAISSESPEMINIGRVGFLTLLISISLSAYFQFRKKKNIPFFLNSYLWITIAWFKMGEYWLAGGHFALIFLEQLAGRQLLVTINEKEIEYPSLPTKRITWGEVNNVILKDGILTIDCRNNRIFQQEIMAVWNEEKINLFNEFCRKKLQAATNK